MRILLFWLLFSSTVYATGADLSETGLWRQIRDGAVGYSAVVGRESNRLIQSSGADWLYLRNELIAGTGAWFLAITVLALAAFYLIRGQVKLSQPRSGELVERWSKTERWLHFYTATLFLLLAFSGLILLYGRILLIDSLGHDGFSLVAQSAKITHNYTGPLFIVGLLLMMIFWLKDNLINKTDIVWFREFGGMIGTRHPSAGRMNGGEKAWFWLLIAAGLTISASGLMLDFSNFGQTRFWLQVSHIAHSISAFLLMVGALGHIYIGTIGTEGALEGMINGYVDASWAKQHHDLWYQALKREAGEATEKTENNNTHS